MKGKLDYGEILTVTEQLGPYPMEKLKRVEQPTNLITSGIKRIDTRDGAFVRAKHGYYGEAVQREFLRIKDPVYATLKEMTLKFQDIVEGEVSSSKPELPEDPAVLSRHIKRLGYFHRADVAGICELPRWAVHSHDEEGNPIEQNHKYAAVFLVDQDFKTMDASSGHDWISRGQSTRSYVHTALIACMVASYIRKLGYSARAHHLTNEQVVIPPLLLMAGVGEVSRAGIILNPFLGLRFKAAVVTTDMPLIPDKPIDFGLQEFCRQCGKCAVHCPSQAITHGDQIMHNGYMTWKLAEDRCARYRILNPNGDFCGRCIKVCPWNKPRGWTHDIVKRMVRHAPWMDKLIIKMDDVWGYGKENKKGKWWFDMESADGGFKVVEGRREDKFARE